MKNVEIVPVRAFQDNYIWVMRSGADAAVVDPGDAQPVIEYLEREQLRLAAILNTHHHADHIGGNEALLRRWNVPVHAPYDERITSATHRVRHGERVSLPELDIGLSVLEVPGHTRSHIAFVSSDALFCGDTLFACGCGRLFEGTPAQMHASLSRLMALPDATRVYCGHEYTLSNLRFAKAAEPDNVEIVRWEREASGQRARDEPTLPSTLARERLCNPFVRCHEAGVRATASAFAGMPLTDPVDVLAAIRNWKNKF